jgi:hypothetical protein
MSGEPAAPIVEAQIVDLLEKLAVAQPVLVADLVALLQSADFPTLRSLFGATAPLTGSIQQDAVSLAPPVVAARLPPASEIFEECEVRRSCADHFPRRSQLSGGTRWSA